MKPLQTGRLYTGSPLYWIPFYVFPMYKIFFKMKTFLNWTLCLVFRGCGLEGFHCSRTLSLLSFCTHISLKDIKCLSVCRSVCLIRGIHINTFLTCLFHHACFVIFLYDLFFADARINITVEYFYSLQVLKENYLTLFKFPKKKLVATSIGQILIYTNFYAIGKNLYCW